jgi:hypothetical protein
MAGMAEQLEVVEFVAPAVDERDAWCTCTRFSASSET